MEFVIWGTDFGHKRGEFCVRSISGQYLLSYFRTDYLYEKDGELLEGRAGDMLIMPPGVTVYHGPISNMTEGFVNDWIYVGGDDFSAMLDKYPLPLATPFRASDGELLARCIRKINAEASYKLCGHTEKCDGCMTELIIDLYREYTRQTAASVTSAIELIRSEFLKDPKRSWTLSSMAEFCGYSESRFSALYKQKYSLSPISDLIDIRLKQAQMLLRYSPLSISEIADSVGFGSIFYFSKAFKSAFGLSPTEYRREYAS